MERKETGVSCIPPSNRGDRGREYPSGAVAGDNEKGGFLRREKKYFL